MRTPEQLAAAMDADPGIKALVDAVVESVAAAGQMGAPAGHLYAALMGHLSLEQFQMLMGAIVAAGKLERRGLLYFKRGAP